MLCAEDDAQQGIIALGRPVRRRARGAGAGRADDQQLPGQVFGLDQRGVHVFLDHLPGQALIGRGRLVQKDIDRDFDARHPVHETVEKRADNSRPDGQGGVLVELDGGLRVLVGKLCREIGGDDDGDLGPLAVHGGAGGLVTGGERDLDQIRHVFTLQDADD
jgi:hypothetical protein